MMNSKVTAIRMRGKEIAFDAPTINVLVATQNKLIKEELVDKLGLLTRSRRVKDFCTSDAAIGVALMGPNPV